MENSGPGDIERVNLLASYEQRPTKSLLDHQIKVSDEKGKQILNTHNVHFRSNSSRLSWAMSALTLRGNYCNHCKCFLVSLSYSYYHYKLFNIIHLVYLLMI